jgi:hypothetical protein
MRGDEVVILDDQDALSLQHRMASLFPHGTNRLRHNRGSAQLPIVARSLAEAV